MEHLNMAQAAGIASLNSANAALGQAVTSAAMIDQLGERIAKLSGVLGDAASDLTMVGERLFGPQVVAGNTGANKEPSPQGAAERLMLMLDHALVQAVNVADRARGLNSRI